MKKTAILILLAASSYGINYTPLSKEIADSSYATTGQVANLESDFSALENDFNLLISTNGITLEYADANYLAIFGSNTLNESGIVHFEITCVEDGGANDKLFIHDIDFHYQADKIGSDEENPNGL